MLLMRPARRGRPRRRLGPIANGGAGTRDERGRKPFAAARAARATLWVKGRGRSLPRQDHGRGARRGRRGRRLDRGGAAAGGGTGPSPWRGPGQEPLSQPAGRRRRALSAILAVDGRQPESGSRAQPCRSSGGGAHREKSSALLLGQRVSS